MKKGIASNFTVKRISTSPYFNAHFNQLEKKTLEDLGQITMLEASSSEDADIIITNTHTKLEALNSEQLKKCKLLIHPNSGYDNFSYDFVKSTSFPIVLGNPIRAHAVANYILSALLAHYAPIDHQSSWSKERFFPRKLLNELSVLILGEGHIGQLLKESLSPLVSTLLISDPYKGKEVSDFKNIDVLILACSLNPSSYQLIDHKKLLELNSDFLFINAARGSLVKTSDLLEVLKNQPQAYAVLDVFEKEPADFGPFQKFSNLKTTSHIAGVYSSLDVATVEFERIVINHFLNESEADFLKNFENLLLKNRLHDHYLI